MHNNTNVKCIITGYDQVAERSWMHARTKDVLDPPVRSKRAIKDAVSARLAIYFAEAKEPWEQ
jgi:hypothetical protein